MWAGAMIVYLGAAFLVVFIGGLQCLAAVMSTPADRYEWLRSAPSPYYHLPELYNVPILYQVWGWSFRL